MTQIMGIVNLTPDSFSGDGSLLPQEIIPRIDAMIERGAAVIDIGAESTRPGAVPLSAQEEWRRLAPVVEVLGERTGKVEFSLDTRHAQTARRALGAGFKWINDVSGGASPEMIEVVRDSACRFVIMHSLSVPASPAHVIDPSSDAVEELLFWGQERIDALVRQGLQRSHLIFDPGIGFGKTAKQSLQLIKHIGFFKALDVPLLVGHSRKSFLSLFDTGEDAGRDQQTISVSCYLASQGVDYLRVHDVASHVAVLGL